MSTTQTTTGTTGAGPLSGADETGAAPSAGNGRAPARRAPWSLVAAREVQVRLTDRTFLLSTVFTVVLILGAMIVPTFLAGGGTEYTVAVTGPQARAVVEQVDPATLAGLSFDGEETTVVAEEVADRSAAEEAVLAGDVDVALVGGPGEWAVLSDGGPPGVLLGAVSDVVRTEALAVNAEAAGTTLAELTAGTQVRTVDLAVADDDAMPEQMVFLLGFGFAFLFYMAAIMFGMQIASSVVEEKQSRIVEILAAAIPVRQLLLGKVVGNTLLAFGQMALIVATSLVGLSFTDLDVALPGLAEAVGWYLPFFLLGFVALACIWAAAGALASRTEDLQSTTMPLTMVLVVAFIAALNLEGVWREVASFVPLLSTLLMPLRILEGEVSWWQPVVALVLVALFCLVTILVGSRLYQRALLHTSGSLSWRRALRLSE